MEQIIQEFGAKNFSNSDDKSGSVSVICQLALHYKNAVLQIGYVSLMWSSALLYHAPIYRTRAEPSFRSLNPKIYKTVFVFSEQKYSRTTVQYVVSCPVLCRNC